MRLRAWFNGDRAADWERLPDNWLATHDENIRKHARWEALTEAARGDLVHIVVPWPEPAQPGEYEFRLGYEQAIRDANELVRAVLRGMAAAGPVCAP